MRVQQSAVTSTITIVATMVVLCATSPVRAQKAFDFPNHHLHNFYVSKRTYEHAVAMGYRLVPSSHAVDRDSSPAFGSLGRIRNHNSHICPLRVQVRKHDGTLFVTYHSHAGTTVDGLNPVALAYGIRRKNSGYGRRTEMDADDLRMLKGYGAARVDVSDLTTENASYEEIQKRFHTSWPLEDARFKSCNVLCNWQSRKVVNDMLEATLENISWGDYDALFFDSLSGGARKTANAEFGGLGTYATGLDGKLAFVKAVVEFVRDPAKTGRPHPYLVFTNIYDPVGRTAAKTWYGSGQLRLDHYYFEKGSKDAGSYLTHHGYVLGRQYANGVVPGTTQAAYVNLDESGDLADPESYLPANLVALDDAYTWSMRVSRKPDFDHAAFFDQHLDACGTAGIQGSWFGWYGEDYVTIKDTEDRLIYSNACQLLRAIPNWDNIHGIPVPPFKSYSPTDQRRWDGSVYHSTQSHASKDVVYSRNPDNEELYIVFRRDGATVSLLPGETPVEACFVNPWFSKTKEDALASLRHDHDRRTIKLADSGKLGRGIRIITTLR
jgi:hypothetical protein